MSKELKARKPKNGKVVVVGAGNVGSVALHKMVQYPESFKEIYVLMRSQEKFQRVLTSIHDKFPNHPPVYFQRVDASNFEELSNVMRSIHPDLVMNLGPPYWNFNVMLACLESKAHYLDTACHECPDRLGFTNKGQLSLHNYFQREGLMAQLQIGFDPGVTNTFVAYCLQEKIFDKISSIDILDCNAGKKNAVWAPNFDPEINIRELVLPIRAIHKGEWTGHGRLIDRNPLHFSFDFPQAGPADAYLMYHEELESLHDSFPEIERMRFWMTFSEENLTHLRVLYNVGLTSIEPVIHEGHSITPVQFLKTILPKGEDFNESYRGKTNIGIVFQGEKDGEKKVVYIYQVCDHRQAFLETGGNAIGYTTAVPAVTAAMMIMGEDCRGGPWLNESGVIVPENQKAKVFLEQMARNGLPWEIITVSSLPISLAYLANDTPQR